MAFRLNNAPEQMSLFNRGFILGKRKEKLLNGSWAKIFAEDIFPAIDENVFSPLYSDDAASRPNAPVNVIVGALMLKELLGLSDKEIVYQSSFNYMVEVALHTADYEDQPISERTLARFRKRCCDYAEETGIDLLHDCIEPLSKKISALMDIDGTIRRMDSLMISSNIRKLSRTELIYVCMSKLIKRLMADGLVEIPEEFEHYVDPNDFNRTFYYKASDETDDTLKQLLADCDRLLEICGDSYKEVEEYKNFIRCLNEQTVKENDGRRLSKKEDGTLHSEVLQNPADPDATFREKAGKEHRGYVANVEESVGVNGSIVTDYQLEKNTYSDSQFFEDRLNRMDDSETEGKSILYTTDGAYASQHNLDLAAEKNVNLVTTSLTGKETPDILADFEFNEEGTEITKCPEGYEPTKQSYYPKTEQVRAVFDGTKCANCPHRNECPAKVNEKGTAATVTITKKGSNRAKIQRQMKSEDFGKYGRLRNGVETIPSILRRKYQVDKMARGIHRNRFKFGCKIAALNINKLFRFRQGLLKPAQNPLLG